MKNYFKKFSIMFMMAFAIMLGNSVNAFAESSVVTDKRVYLPGEKINVTYALDNVKFGRNPWAGIVPANISHGNELINDQNDVQYLFLNAYSAKLIFTAPTKSGIYDIRINDQDDSGNEVASSSTFEVSSKPLSISLNKTSITLAETTSEQLTTTAVEVTWSSSDTSIATVDLTGKVTAVKKGQATITATTADGLIATCIVTVTPKGTDPNPTPNPEPTNIVNIAHAKGDNTNNAGGGVTIIFNGVADATLSVVKTADVKSVYVGDTFTYTIVVTNTGSKTAKAVVINDSAPNHIDFMVGGITTTQGKVDPNSTSKNIMVNVGDIPPSGTVTIKIPVTVIL